MSIKSSARLKKRRSGEPWVSNNRVLAGSSLKRTTTVGRNPNFDTDETKLLIHLWGDPKLQRTLITTHKKHVVICQLAAKMEEYGYHRSPEEITTRIKNLKCFYNRLKKEMDNGLTNEPTWKHFGEMDAIMTRPIFSVRPNEVPAPSLKYQIEQAREERQERRKKMQEKGGDISESENEEDDMLVASLVAKHKKAKMATALLTKHDSDDGIIPDVEIDMDINDETFATLTTVTNSERRKIIKSLSILDDEEGDVDVDDDGIKDEPESEEDMPLKGDNFYKYPKEKQIQSKEAPRKEDKTVTNGLVIPKEEPIDVDADSDSNDNDITGVRALMPTLADILQMSKSNVTLTANGNVCIPVSNISSISPLVSKSSSTETTNDTTLTTTMAQQGKISLVPTNFLMQPKSVSTHTTSTINSAKQSHVHMLQNGQFQSRILLSGPQANNASANMIATSSGGMKLLLLNPEQATNTNAAVKNKVTTQNSGLSNSAVLPLGATFQPLQIQQQQISQPTIATQKFETSGLSKRKHSLEKHSDDAVMTKREAISLRILLRQLLNAQNECNEIQHNRLSLERERLDWEKALAERLFTILPTMPLLKPPRSPPQPSSEDNAHVQPTLLQSQQQQFIAAQVSSNAQRLNPPKLVFTTALPATNSTHVPQSTPPTTNLTSSLPKVANSVTQNMRAVSPGKSVEICTQINDIKLVTPKVEQYEV